MKVVPTQSQLRRATKLSNNLPLFQTSITKNRYGRHGLLAEILFAESGLLPPVQFETRKPNLFNHDLFTKGGLTFEVKTRVMNRHCLPCPGHYSVHLSEHSCTRQNPDYFLFAMCDRECSVFYLLGAMRNKDKYTLKGRKLRKVGEHGAWVVHRNVNTYPISSLLPLEILQAETLKHEQQSLLEQSKLEQSTAEST